MNERTRPSSARYVPTPASSLVQGGFRKRKAPPAGYGDEPSFKPRSSGQFSERTKKAFSDRPDRSERPSSFGGGGRFRRDEDIAGSSRGGYGSRPAARSDDRASSFDGYNSRPPSRFGSDRPARDSYGSDRGSFDRSSDRGSEYRPRPESRSEYRPERSDRYERPRASEGRFSEGRSESSYERPSFERSRPMEDRSVRSRFGARRSDAVAAPETAEKSFHPKARAAAPAAATAPAAAPAPQVEFELKTTQEESFSTADFSSEATADFNPEVTANFKTKAKNESNMESTMNMEMEVGGFSGPGTTPAPTESPMFSAPEGIAAESTATAPKEKRKMIQDHAAPGMVIANSSEMPAGGSISERAFRSFDNRPRPPSRLNESRRFDDRGGEREDRGSFAPSFRDRRDDSRGSRFGGGDFDGGRRSFGGGSREGGYSNRFDGRGGRDGGRFGGRGGFSRSAEDRDPLAQISRVAPTPPKPEISADNAFQTFTLNLGLLQAIEVSGFKTPTTIQEKAIPLVLDQKDLLACSETGSGKTAAFSIPMIEKMLRVPGTLSLILVPTREIAIQIETVIRKLTIYLPELKTGLFIGGVPLERQFRSLRSNPRILIATPGRLVDLLDRGAIALDKTTMLVLDEADRMLDMGFAPQLNEIADQLPKERQTLLFSATLASSVERLARRYLQNPISIQVGQSSQPAQKIQQSVMHVASDQKTDVLLDELNSREGSILIFARTKRRTDQLTDTLEDYGHPVGRIHGDRSQAQRIQAIEAFRNGKIRILVATDVAARGIDIKAVGHVINYDLPESPEDYIHRIGRTGRAGAEGQALSLLVPQERGLWRGITALLQRGKNAQPPTVLKAKSQAQKPSLS